MWPPPRFCLSDGHLLVLSMPVVFCLGRSSKRVVVTANMIILDKIPVHLPEVELVRLYFLWQHAEALFIPNRSLEKVSCHFLMTAIRKIALYMLDS